LTTQALDTVGVCCERALCVFRGGRRRSPRRRVRARALTHREGASAVSLLRVKIAGPSRDRLPPDYYYYYYYYLLYGIHDMPHGLLCPIRCAYYYHYYMRIVPI